MSTGMTTDRVVDVTGAGRVCTLVEAAGSIRACTAGMATALVEATGAARTWAAGARLTASVVDVVVVTALAGMVEVEATATPRTEAMEGVFATVQSISAPVKEHRRKVTHRGDFARKDGT